MSTAALQAFIEKLPPLDMSWPDDLQIRWMRIASALLNEAERNTFCWIPPSNINP